MVEPVRLLHLLSIKVIGGYEQRHAGQSHHPHQLGDHGHVYQLKHLDDQVDLSQIVEQQAAYQLPGLEHEFTENADNDSHQPYIEEEHRESHAIEQ